MLITGSIDSIRNLPVTALFGAQVIFFFAVGALIFLIPTALVSAQLSTLLPQDGGIYYWLQHAFGKRTACLGVWLQWINTMVWFPTILSFVAGTLAYLINPALANNRFYLLAVVLLVFWGMTWVNLRGLQKSARFASFCAVWGLLVPFALIVILGAVWLLRGQHLQVSLAVQHWLPHAWNSGSWISLTGVVTAFLGMELATVHLGNINNASRLFPPALMISVVLILAIMVFGALTIAIVVPSTHISLVAGVMQTFAIFLQAYHVHWILPVIAILVLVGSLGSMVNWLISPAKGLMHAAEDGFLPQRMLHVNKHGVPSTMLLLQAVVVTCICGSMFLMPSVNGSYWLLTDLSTQLYLLMYAFMFLGAVAICANKIYSKRQFALCGGKLGMFAVCLLGLLGCALCLVVWY